MVATTKDPPRRLTGVVTVVGLVTVIRCSFGSAAPDALLTSSTNARTRIDSPPREISRDLPSRNRRVGRARSDRRFRAARERRDCTHRRLARAHAVCLGGHPRHAAHVDADRREGPARVGADGEPLVAGHALRVGARAHDLADARGRERDRDRVRLRRPRPRPAHDRRPTPPGGARAALGRELLRGDDGPRSTSSACP